MSEERNDGGSAFPQNDLSAYGMGPYQGNNSGMSLRDWFAGQIICAMVNAATGQPLGTSFTAENERYAAAAYAVADAMLRVRATTPSE